jgi:hypothetical protein
LRTFCWPYFCAASVRFCALSIAYCFLDFGCVVYK